FNNNNNNTAETRLHLYQGVRKAREEMVNILVDGGRKYNKHRRKKTKQNIEGWVLAPKKIGV
ncbi:hypothetical protein BDF14DRAFT_1796041, partial [Spinellus fusiger]